MLAPQLKFQSWPRSFIADAELLEEADVSSALPHVWWAQFVTERGERRKDLQARMDAREARTRRS
eukprot:2922775-Pleurochrysis_carterae.AAC.1